MMLSIWYSAPFPKSIPSFFGGLERLLFLLVLLIYFLGLRWFQQKDKFSYKCSEQGIELKLVHTQHLEEMQGLFGIQF
jgi:hypothetical protein